MLMRDFGFVSRWTDQFSIDVHQCTVNPSKKGVQSIPLGLKELSGAFIFFIVGCFISLFALIAERNNESN